MVTKKAQLCCTFGISILHLWCNIDAPILNDSFSVIRFKENTQRLPLPDVFSTIFRERNIKRK